MTEMEMNAENVCCIAHAFCRGASSNSDKIAVVHASGGFRTSIHEDTHISEEEFIRGSPEADSPPLYPGDVSYTFGELQSAVNALAIRITNVLAGGDDPDLTTPKGIVLEEGEKDVHFETNSNIGVMAGERTKDWSIMVYKDFQDPPSISRQSMEEQAGEHDVYYRSPQIVGIYLVPSAEYIVAILAVLRSGAAFLPLDPSWPKKRVLAVVSASKVCLILSCCQATDFCELEGLLWGGACPILRLSDGYAKSFIAEGKYECDLSWPCQSKKRRTFCYVMYTSGSTGKPKGVCGTEEGLLNRFIWMETLYPHLAHDLSCFKTAISFIDHLPEILGPLLSCTPLVIPPFNEFKGNPLLLVDMLKVYHVTRLTTTPSLMRALLPALQSSNGRLIQKFLRVLVLSGEALPIWLWEVLHGILRDTSILNLYGTTEISGDCAYFDCKNLPKLLKDQPLNSVPIGRAILGCEVMLVSDRDSLDSLNTEGEIWVRGKCLALRYLDDAAGNASKFVNLNLTCGVHHVDSNSEVKNLTFFRTGDFARKLNDGNYVFLGRKDRMVKVNGQLIALEEIEYNLRKHPDVADAAASFYYCKRGDIYITAYIVLKTTGQSFLYGASSKQESHSHLDEGTGIGSHTSWRKWLQERLTSAMIPHRFLFVETLPLSPSGKIDYVALPQIEPSVKGTKKAYGGIQLEDGDIQIIKEAFRRALMVEVVSDYDDFFSLGGTSISAAHVAHSLGIDMRFIYKHPSPHGLYNAMQQIPGLLERISGLDSFPKPPSEMRDGGRGKGIPGVSDLHVQDMNPGTPSLVNITYQEVSSILGFSTEEAQGFCREENFVMHALGQSGITKNDLSFENYNSQPQKKQRLLQLQTHMTNAMGEEHWLSHLNLPEAVAFTRCNKVISQGQIDNHSVLQNSCAILRDVVAGSLRQLWKVQLHSCVDASPLVVKQCDKCYLFIGSHAHNFSCIDAISGEVQWEAILGGRVECTAAITDDFTQVVVGCYNGMIYFLEFLSGRILWSFQTGGEVKSQPIVDKLRGLVWCGSYDHNIYALDVQHKRCVFKIPCGGSVFGAPVYDMARSKVYVAATSGRVTAVNLEGTTFNVSWSYESQAPIFGSLATESCTGYVLCSLVNGNVIALSATGSLVWQARTEGPLFSGPCISPSVSSQVLLCSRDGFVYSFDLKRGNCLWKHLIGEPITSSAYVDETIQLVSQQNNLHQTAYRLVCICSSSGSIHVLKVGSDAANQHNHASTDHFTDHEEVQNVSLNNPRLNQSEVQTQKSLPTKFCTDLIDKYEDQDSNGQFIFSYEFAKLKLPGDIFSSPVMLGGRIFVGCRDDHVYCISMEL